MPRKLKAYTTSAGYFDVAVAAPSIKAAVDASGSTNNLFHQASRGCPKIRQSSRRRREAAVGGHSRWLLEPPYSGESSQEKPSADKPASRKVPSSDFMRSILRR